ncbi:hypothetical protein BGX29_003163 [Mortierella sp. GBA35]|nr:hypothetical protein BGX29_003163 [Mortierella sp. GBA35]
MGLEFCEHYSKGPPAFLNIACTELGSGPDSSSRGDVDAEVVVKILFGIPPSIASVSNVVDVRHDRRDTPEATSDNEQSSSDESTPDNQPISDDDERASNDPTLQEPLRKLPVTLEVPLLQPDKVIQRTARHNVDHYPKLNHMTLHFDANFSVCTELMVANAIIQAIPQDTLKSGFQPRISERRHGTGGLFCSAFRLAGQDRVPQSSDDYTLCTILGGCRVLEMFDVASHLKQKKRE